MFAHLHRFSSETIDEEETAKHENERNDEERAGEQAVDAEDGDDGEVVGGKVSCIPSDTLDGLVDLLRPGHSLYVKELAHWLERRVVFALKDGAKLVWRCHGYAEEL